MSERTSGGRAGTPPWRSNSLVAVGVIASTALASCSQATPDPASERGRTASGLYWEASGAGEAVVLAHGFSLDLRSWDGLARALEPRYRVVRYDQRGHGRSDPIAGPYSAERDLLGVLDDAGIQRATIVGLSAGAELAVDFALGHPSRVARLVLASPGLGGYTPIGSFEWMAPVMEELRAGRPESAMGAWTETPLMKILADPRADSVMSAQARENWRIWTFDPASRVRIDPPAVSRLAQIDAPALVVVGSRDLADTHRVADTLVACLPHATRLTIEGAGHLVSLEAPEAFEDAVKSFLEGSTPESERPHLERGSIRACNGTGAAGPRSSGGQAPAFEMAPGAFLAVRVGDVDEAARWYAEALDLVEVNRIDAEDGRYGIRILSRPGLAVELIRMRGPETPPADRSLGLFKAGFHVTDIDDAFRVLRARGVDTDQAIFTDPALDARSFVFRDPFGNRIQVFQACAAGCPP